MGVQFRIVSSDGAQKLELDAKYWKRKQKTNSLRSYENIPSGKKLKSLPSIIHDLPTFSSNWHTMESGYSEIYLLYNEVKL